MSTPVVTLISFAAFLLGVFFGLSVRRSGSWHDGHRAGVLTGYRKGFERGKEEGRDEEWIDAIIREGRQDRARRNKLGQFKGKERAP